MTTPLARLCGHLVVGGFDGLAPSATFLQALARGERGGAVLFARNVPKTEDGAVDLEPLADTTRALARAADDPPIVAVDQEGGRVARLRAPLMALPPMARVGRLPKDLVQRVAAAHGAELAALGFTTPLAPVLDVHTRPENPVIGDRAFGGDPDTVARAGLAWAAGLAEAGVFACGKHFPGHGDTALDSHVDQPVVTHGAERLRAVEIAPCARV